MTTSELKKLCAVKGTMVFPTVKHSHNYISHACTIDTIKKCFRDLSIAKNITCDKTKVSIMLVKLNCSYGSSYLLFRLVKSRVMYLHHHLQILLLLNYEMFRLSHFVIMLRIKEMLRWFQSWYNTYPKLM